MAKKPVFKVFHDTGEIDDIINSMAYVIHSEKVDFKKNSLTFDKRFLIGGEKIIAIPIMSERGLSTDYPVVTDVVVSGNTVSWKYAQSSGLASSTIPIILIIKLMGAA